MNPLNELTAMQHVAVSQRRKASVESCIDTESSTSAAKRNVRRALANDRKCWPIMVIINISLGSCVCLAAV